jgi:hypothetical protein
VLQLAAEEELPDGADARVDLGLEAGVIVRALGVLVEDPLLQPRLRGVHQRLVLRDVLLLDVGDLGVELARFRRAVEVAHRLVKVHRLLLAGHEREDVHLGPRLRAGLLVVVQQAQHRVIVVVLGRARR